MTHAGDVDTVLADGVIRKQNGVLTGFDLAEVTRLSHNALAELETRIRDRKILNAQEVEAFFRLAERMASFHFAQAYSDEFFVQAMKQS